MNGYIVAAVAAFVVALALLVVAFRLYRRMKDPEGPGFESGKAALLSACAAVALGCIIFGAWSLHVMPQ